MVAPESSRLRLRSLSSSCGPSRTCSFKCSVYIHGLPSFTIMSYPCAQIFLWCHIIQPSESGCWQMDPLSVGFPKHWTCVKPASARICFSFSSASFKVKSVSMAGFTSSIWVNLVFGLTSCQSDFRIFDAGFWTYFCQAGKKSLWLISIDISIMKIPG